jgi:hypothetical protein
MGIERIVSHDGRGRGRPDLGCGIDGYDGARIWAGDGGEMERGGGDAGASRVGGEDRAREKRPVTRLVVRVERYAATPHAVRREFANHLAQRSAASDLEVDVAAVNAALVGQRVMDGEAHSSNLVECAPRGRQKSEAR